MRITLQTENELLLEDSGQGLVAFGALALAASAITAVFAVPGAKNLLALFVVAAFGLSGIVMIARARAQTHHFDLRRGALTIASRPALALLGTTQEVVRHPLASLQDVVLEDGGSVHGDRSIGSTYRLAYVFADGARHPLRPYYTTGRAGYVALQERLRAVIERMRRS